MKEALEARLERLRKEREKYMNTIYTLDGHIRECEYWIKNTPAPQVPPKAQEVVTTEALK